MPSYDYQCKQCGERYTYAVPYSATLQARFCTCGAKLKRVYHNVPVFFNGRGFYVNDSKEKHLTT